MPTAHPLDGVERNPNAKCGRQPTPLFSDSTHSLIRTTNVTNPSEYQTKLAQRKDELMVEIAALNTAHNSVAGICRLPAEILSRVFLELSSMTTIHSPIDADEKWTKLLWVRATNVCRHWREVANNCPTLWASPAFNSNPDLAAMMLSRSKHAPLSIRYIGTRTHPPEALYDALAQIERLRSVEVMKGKREPRFWEIISGWSNAPILRTLVLVNSNYHDSNISLDRALPINAPSLRKLEIKRCGIAWKHLPIGSAITHLNLYDDIRKHNHRPSSDALASALESMPRLRSLALSGYLPSAADSRSRRVILPVLEMAVLRDETPLLSKFFQLYALPSTAAIGITFMSHLSSSNIAETVANLKSSMQAGPSRTGSPSILNGVDAMAFSTRNVHLWAKNDGETDPRLKLSSVRGDPPNEFIPEVDYLFAIKEQFDLTTLEGLSVAKGDWLTAIIWKMVFTPLPKLMVITLEACRFDDFFQAFQLPDCPGNLRSEGDEALPMDHQSLRPFPSLSLISLNGMDLTVPGRAVNAHLLRDILAHRSTFGPIKRLGINKCINFGWFEYFQLQKGDARTQVEWDRHGVAEDEDDDYYSSD
ncbi:hypothetical protein D9611_002738 [Ephemerocybe angulata]|uniref:F-box domain-containing protein n=1 Tax=Ephemerocybe angulata TaxID=980116 RepID=A0A8H5C1F1_9AGAR|nr:hypothetical protein D9611_002738 [Tulosesus angulatus]